MTWDDPRIETAYHELADRASSHGIADLVADAIRMPVERVGGTNARSGRAWLAIAAVSSSLRSASGPSRSRTPRVGPATAA